MDGQAASLDATAALLWAACRPAPDDRAIAAAAAAGADMRMAARVGSTQRVGPLLLRALDACGLTNRLGDDAVGLRREAEFRRVQAQILLPLAVATLLEPLNRSGVEAVVLKGARLAERYPEPGLRPMDDIDLMVARGDHARALDALVRAGWRVVERPFRSYDSYLTHPGVPDLPVEVHWDISTWRDRTCGLRGATLWAARRPVECFDVPAFGLPPELELLALAVHAGKPHHVFHRLIWSVDFAVVLADAGPAFDWDTFGRATRQAGCPTVVAVALKHAVRLGASVPEQFLRLPVGRFREAALAPLADERWPVDRGSVYNRLRYVLSDSPARWLLLMAAELLAAGPAAIPRTAVSQTRRALSLTRRMARGSR